MAESKLSDFEREKMIIELEIKELIARHKTEVTEKMARAAHVSCGGGRVKVECVRGGSGERVKVEYVRDGSGGVGVEYVRMWGRSGGGG